MTKKDFNYEEIIMSLNDIKGYVQSYLYSLGVSEKLIDRKEIDMYLSAIPEIVEDIILLLDELYAKENN